MVFSFHDDGSAPPPAGVPSGGSSTSAFASYAADAQAPAAGGAQSGDFFALGPDNPMLFVGTKKLSATGTLPGSPESKTASQYLAKGKILGMTPGGTPITGRTLNDLQDEFARSSNDNIKHWAYLLGLTGYAGVSPTNAVDFAKQASKQDVLKAHLAFLSDAADQFNIYNRKLTPQQLMKNMLSYQLGDKFDGKLSSVTPDKNGALFGNSGTHTQTTRSVDLMSAEDAKGMVRSKLQEVLGRDPTQAEYEDFIATIHAAERKNPTTSKSTYSTDDQGNTTNQNTTTSGGLSQSGVDQVLYDKARKMPDYAVWQAVGTYAPALFAALDAPVSGV